LPADAAAVWALHNLALTHVGAHPGNGPWDDDLHAIEVVYLDSNGEFLIGECDGQIVAMGALLRLTARRAEIKRMRVHPAYQRRGFGRALLRRLESCAANLGYTELELATTVQQAAAQGLYQAEGYTETRRFLVGSFTCIAFQKQLALPPEVRHADDEPLPAS
jgi:ribosomal protein S18 acetylase RimI-like enzyme